MPETPDYIAKLYTLPPHMRVGIRLWIEHGHNSHPGGFLCALLRNDLMDAIGRADSDNLAALGDWATYLYNYAPLGSYGSPEAFDSWRGLVAMAAEQEA